ncbi:tRNA(5-methylaminomethyl-2-thiouridylate) methyltransferase [Maridesulfovibrio sp.]|uniref:tRNA(5-methylaminomethyl-2-thiouridylate) methyltransferase n=1 Tax=Maridesulfovibrio sp. TaxID=2795000 RepID=UPI002A18837E|nr:tRNA(5-methylaminomethyl-2-thiouridylate) methyltransferase [Maridesulfovibrio sp.]
MNRQYDALALFSGGLDSILASRVIQDQGLKVLGLHFITPFFGSPEKIPHWEKIYGVEIIPIDISEKFIQMLLDGPDHGMGKLVNPCVDCKIMMISHAKSLLESYGAKFIISGEVTGQRPMSQRPPTLNAIRNSSGSADVLLRPLCAQSQPITPMEESGLVDREKLPNIFGRGRKTQLEMARQYGFSEIPTPAGGCKLTEVENAARFYPLLRRLERADVNSFRLAITGRQYWAGNKLMAIGRNRNDNERIEDLFETGDYMFEVRGFPGPLSVGRAFLGEEWSGQEVLDAAALTASFSPKAVASGEAVHVAVIGPSGESVVTVEPARETSSGFALPDLEGLKEWKKSRDKNKLSG